MPSTRHALLKTTRGPDGPVLSAEVPIEMSREEFLQVAGNAYDMVAKMTHCNCMSGRISFVVADLYAEAARVEFGT